MRRSRRPSLPPTRRSGCYAPRVHDHCPRDGTLCATCLRFRVQGLDGVAANAGQRWGRERRASEPRPIRWWPAWSEASREERAAAHQRGAGNETHPQIREALARRCWDAARVEYLEPAPRPGDLVAMRPVSTLAKWLREIDGST